MCPLTVNHTSQPIRGYTTRCCICDIMRLIHCLTGVIKLANTKVIDYEKLYSLAKIGLSEEQIATSLGISRSTFTRRKRDDEHLTDLKGGEASGHRRGDECPVRRRNRRQAQHISADILPEEPSRLAG